MLPIKGKKIFKFENKSLDPIQNCRPENQVKKTQTEIKLE